eukprot:6665953-Pyramimonas_sp.AAC.1
MLHSTVKAWPSFAFCSIFESKDVMGTATISPGCHWPMARTPRPPGTLGIIATLPPEHRAVSGWSE